MTSKTISNLNIDRTWTLFLDRDGVINKKRDNDYVKNLDELEILPGALEAITKFSDIFGRIFIVTNQQGIGKGLMTHEDLSLIHREIMNRLDAEGGKIDAIYYAPQLVAENSEMRKPEIGMALLAQHEFPEVDFSKSIMVGDSISDMEFGENAGMFNVYIHSNKHDKFLTFESLKAFAAEL